MKVSSRLTLLCLLLFAPEHGWSIPAVKDSIEDHCDRAGGAVNDFRAPSPQACQAACRQQPACEGFTFISGWDRCFLRKNLKGRTKITMYSGESGQKPEGDHDYTGKDLLQLSAKNPDDCAQLCSKNKSCLAFTYIGGYSTCWLKKTKGRLLPKVFYCGGR